MPSPLPVKIRDINRTGLTWGEASEALLDGKKVRRQEWPADHFGYVRADVLHIHRSSEGLDGTEHRWLVGTGDLAGADWEVVN